MNESTRVSAPAEPEERLQKLWQQGQRPDLQQFLSDAGELSPSQLLDVLLVDQRERWQRGERLGAEKYLRLAPALEADVEHTIQLIYGEFRLREELGEGPILTEYAERFPAHAERLKLQVELHQALASGVGSGSVEAMPDTSQTLSDRPSERAQAVPGLLASPAPIRCPHCHNPIQLIDKGPDELLCPACGSSFRLCESRQTTMAQSRRPMGNFELLERVGQGAFGAVWRARDTKLDRIVALKIPHARLLTSAADLERFHREARAAAQLRHPGIVTVHEVQMLDGLPTIVSDFIEGVPLKELLEVRRPTFREAATLVAEVAEALDYAHSMGLVHRDIKPANIMLEHVVPSPFSGAPKGSAGVNALPFGAPLNELRTTDCGLKPLIMDFGLALRQEAETTLTLDGHIVGTPAYMSPEQAEGKGHQADRRSDIYSLGVVLYELLCGELPFRGSTRMLLHQVLHEEPRPPRRVNDKIPRDLETICLKAISKAPARRYATARELAQDLRRFLNGEPVRARPVGQTERLWRWCGRNPRLAGLTASTAIFLLAGTGISSYFAIQANRRAQEVLREKGRAIQALDMLSSQVIDEWLARQKELLPEHRRFLEKALASYESLARDAGQDEASRAGVALAYRHVGYIRNRLGRTQEAERALLRSRELYEQLAVDFPTVPGYRQELAKNYLNLGVLWAATGRARDAERAYGDAIKRYQQLAADFPAVLEYRQLLGRIHNNLGNLLAAAGRAREAEHAYGDALKLLQQLTADLPSVPEYRQELARSHMNLGVLLAANGRVQEAERAYHNSLRLYQPLAADFPTVPEYRQELAKSQMNLGNLLQASRTREAESAYHDALTLQQQLVANFPTVPEYRHELAKSHYNLGNLLQDAGSRAKEAEQAYQEALKLQQRLAADFPTVREYRQDLARTYNCLGLLLAANARPEPAKGAFRDAVKLYQQLATDSPTVPDNQNELAGTMDNLADLLHHCNELRPARELFEQALPHHQAALQANPDNPTYREFFRNNRLSLAQILADLGDHAAAADAAGQLAQAGVDPAGDGYNAACILSRCVPLAERDGRLSEPQRKERAEFYAGRAMATLRQAVQKGYQGQLHLKADKQLDPLRHRADFQKLLAEPEPKARSAPK